MREFMSGKKTYFILGLGVLKVLVMFLAGEMGLMEFLQSPAMAELIAYLGGMAMRAGIGKKA